MNWALIRNMIMTAWALLAVASCGGGGSVASGGTGGTGISSGTVTSFGSVFVNGVEFSTTTSSVTLNGVSGPDETTDPHRGLKVGMVVEVEGSFDDNGTTGSSAEITYKDNLEGPISSITGTTTRTAVILGQTVIMDSQTVIEPAGTLLGSLAQGNFVEVSGLVDDAGQIRATYVEVKTPGVMEVKGTIKSLDTTAKTFQINALTVNYSSATLPSGGLANGQFVEVKGTSSDGGVTLTATEVEIDDDTLGVMDAGKVELEGFVTDVTDFQSKNQFKVGTQVVQTTMSTVFEGTGSIVLGTKLEVEGPLAGGVLTATKVSFH